MLVTRSLALGFGQEGGLRGGKDAKAQGVERESEVLTEPVILITQCDA